MRHPKKPLQLHATGNFWTVLCGPELRRAVDAGDVAEVGQCNLYALAPLFKGWARRWHERKMKARVEGDRAQEEFAKLIGTSLSGKWAQQGHGWQDIFGVPEREEGRMWVIYDCDTKEQQIFRSVPGGVQKWRMGDEPGHCSPIISAYISSYAREYMRWLMTALPARSCYYVGSDALIVNQEAYNHLATAELLNRIEMGKLKSEGPYQSAEIVGTNVYRLGSKWIQSGVHGKPKVGIKLPECSERWEKLPGILARGMDGEVRFTQIPWQESQPRPKGTKGEDGWLTPLWLSFDSHFSDLADRPVLGAAYKWQRPLVPSFAS